MIWQHIDVQPAALRNCQSSSEKQKFYAFCIPVVGMEMSFFRRCSNSQGLNGLNMAFTLYPVDSRLETKIVVQALRLNTLSKLTFADSRRFDGLVKDVFPSVEFQDVDYEKLADALRTSAQELNLVVMPTQVSF